MTADKINTLTSSFYIKAIVTCNFIVTISILYVLTINVHDNNGFMADTKEMFNLFILFVLAISYYFLIKHIRQIGENYLKAIILFSHILLYLITQYLFIDNSITKDILNSEGYAVWHKSSLFFAVPVTLILDAVIGLYMLLNRRKTNA